MYRIFTTLFLLVLAVHILEHRAVQRDKHEALEMLRTLSNEMHRIQQDAQVSLRRRHEHRMHSLASRCIATGHLGYAMQLASMYETGQYPLFRPHPDMAKALYGELSKCPDRRVASEAQTSFLNVCVSTVSREDSRGFDLPLAPGHQVMKTLRAVSLVPEVRVERVVVEPPPPIVQIRNDAQNVHDHGVSSSIRTRVQSLPSSSPQSMESCLSYILESSRDPETKARAVDVMESLSADPHSRIDVSERDALCRVWSKIESLPSDLQSNAKDTLVQQLASGVEDGGIVCSTGKIARIVGALDGIDEDTSIRPTWVIRQEIGQMASQARDSQESADAFRARVTETYADTGMSPAIIESLATEYAEHL